jgi:hypothetical protein
VGQQNQGNRHHAAPSPDATLGYVSVEMVGSHVADGVQQCSKPVRARHREWLNQGDDSSFLFGKVGEGNKFCRSQRPMAHNVKSKAA